MLEFERELRELSRFAPAKDQTDAKLARRFQDGLSIDIKTIVGTMPIYDIQALVFTAIDAKRMVQS